MFRSDKTQSDHKWILIIANLVVVFLIMGILLINNPIINDIINRIDNFVYDARLRASLIHHQPQVFPVVIVDIDDRSLGAEGRWPWSRDKLTTLVKDIHDLGTVVLGFDIVFSEPQTNIVDQLLSTFNKLDIATQVKQELIKNRNYFDYDSQFAEELAKGENVLGFIFTFANDKPQGILPEPIYTLTSAAEKAIEVFMARSYIANITKLSNAAKENGFLTNIADEDGTTRRSPLLMRYGDKLFPSLALEVARRYLLISKIKLDIKTVGNQPTLEGIIFGDYTIPTDEHGQILVPYQGFRGTIPTYSATDILQHKISKEKLANTVVFLGSSALGLGDLKATPIHPIFPGLEIQATIAAGILNKFFYLAPTWTKGVELALIILTGFIMSVCFPYMRPLSITLFSAVLLGIVITTNYLVFEYWNLAIPFVPITALVLVLMIININYRFISEYALRRRIKSLFDQYVSADYINQMIKSSNKEYDFAGDTKTMTVLFADIRNFTAISEGLSVTQLKSLLNDYLTPITEVIFKYQGTVDKYIGDMIMAFWGAPLSDEKHREHGIGAALAMQKIILQMKKNIQEKYKLNEFAVGIGINTGEMDVGDMGSKYRRNYTVLGDPVNLGSRLESLTKQYGVGIIVSDSTKEKLDNYLFRELDRVKVKGKTHMTIIYEPIELTDEQELKTELELHNRALNYYYHQQWQSAMELFVELLKISTRKILYQFYIQRINYLIANPPGADWDGSYVFTTK